MSRTNLVCVVGLLLLAACASSHVEDGQLRGPREPQPGAPNDAAAAGSETNALPRAGSGGFDDAANAPVAGANTTPDGAASPESSPSMDEHARDLVAALAQGPAVWVGQMRTFSQIACVFGESWLDSPFEPNGHLERVVLIAQRDPDTAALTVRIKIGEGTPPASPVELPPLGESDPYWLCIFQFPSAGFEYTAIEPILSNDRLRFTFSPNELWNAWCESREFGCDGPCTTFPPCSCDGGDTICEHFNNQPAICVHGGIGGCECANGACVANLKHRVSVDLVTTSEGGLEGSGSLGSFAEFRLRRVQ